MSEEQKKGYELDINGSKFPIQEEVFHLLLNITEERDFGFDFAKKVREQANNEDADLGKYVKELLVEIESVGLQKTFDYEVWKIHYKQSKD
jgi:hypothetical protein